MKILSTIEEKLLFPFTRILSLILIFLLLCTLITGSFYLGFYDNLNSKTFVSLNEINIELYPVSSTPTIVLPENVKRTFEGENKQVLNSWLDSLKDVEMKKDFLSNLSFIIDEAEKNKQSVVDAINKYKEIKTNKLQTDTLGIATAMKFFKKAFIGFGLFMLLLSILVIIIILLNISIERNTRIKQQE